MILVDTSVWIDHLRKTDPKLVALLASNRVSMHAMVVGELALGSLKHRSDLLVLFNNLPRSIRASDAEVLAFIESQSLWSRGLSLVDAHLLASSLITPDTALWTRDKCLRQAASALGVAV